MGSLGKLWSSESVHINSHNISPLSTLMGSGMLTRLRVVEVEKVTEKLLEAMAHKQGSWYKVMMAEAILSVYIFS